MILDSRGVEVNGNGVDMTERQKAKWMAMNATRQEANDISHAHAVQAMNHLGNQIPALMKKMIEEAVSAALAGYHQSLVDRGVIPPSSSQEDISLVKETRESIEQSPPDDTLSRQDGDSD